MSEWVVEVRVTNKHFRQRDTFEVHQKPISSPHVERPGSSVQR